MALAALIILTLASVAWSLWIRRVTFRCRWEVAASICILFQGLAVLLMSSPASATIGVLLHHVTGVWNLEDYLAGDCYIVSTAALAYRAVISISETDSDVQLAFRQYVERPATLCIPILLCAFLYSDATGTYYSAFFDAPTDGWLKLYWFLLAGILIHLLVYGMWEFRVLHEDPRSRVVADLYLMASAAGIMACAARGVSVFVPTIPGLDGATWLLACGGAIGVALASAYSWQRKLRHFTVRDVGVQDQS